MQSINALPVLIDFLVALHVGDAGPEDGVGAVVGVLQAVRVFRGPVPAKRSQQPLPPTLGSLHGVLKEELFNASVRHAAF